MSGSLALASLGAGAVDRAILIVRQSGVDSDARTTRGDAHKDDDW